MNVFQALLFALVLSLLTSCSQSINPKDFVTKFEQSDSLETVTYEEGIEWWSAIAKASPYVNMQEIGNTDAGLPLHLVIVSPERNFSNEWMKKHNKTIVLINNGIHPGEPDGIDASMLLVREMLASESFETAYKNTVLLIIPFYNVGGALNRNCCSRANQNGPKEYGFRGNARNLDLNRDFLKCDSRNARTFNKLFNHWNPDVYLEPHVSNGADYQYTMTYLLSHPDKLSPAMRKLVTDQLEPKMLQAMEAANDPMIPYVNVFGTAPDSGYYSFYDSPRYSTGYTALHNSLGLLTETHMLKPYPQRVKSTLNFMRALMAFTNKHGAEIKSARQQDQAHVLAQTDFTIDWKNDDEQFKYLTFKGYETYTDTSAVTQLPQHYFDPSKPWTKDIKYFHKLKPTVTVTAPAYYLVPASWYEAVELLALNGVKMELITKDTLVDITTYEITDFETSETPYEGHYLHNNTQVLKQYWSKKIKASEYYLVNVNQPKKRYLIETLEPQAKDAFFNWNFFDEILQQKEWFSTYVFDKEAEDLLAEDEALNKSFKALLAKDPNAKDDKFKQLYFLYRNTHHYERERHMIYPVFRIEP